MPASSKWIGTWLRTRSESTCRFESCRGFHFDRVAQTYRALFSESRGRWLDSSHGHQRVLRCRPTGEASDCRSELGGSDSRSSRQVSCSRRLNQDLGSSPLKAKIRVQFPSGIPWGHHLTVRIEDLQSSNADSISAGPTKFALVAQFGASGPYPEGCGRNSHRAHQSFHSRVAKQVRHLPVKQAIHRFDSCPWSAREMYGAWAGLYPAKL
jgi:hypothetical protein